MWVEQDNRMEKWGKFIQANTVMTYIFSKALNLTSRICLSSISSFDNEEWSDWSRCITKSLVCMKNKTFTLIPVLHVYGWSVHRHESHLLGKFFEVLGAFFNPCLHKEKCRSFEGFCPLLFLVNLISFEW